jgi:hypothetical protein
MTIKVLTVESAAWRSDNFSQGSLLGEFNSEDEALTEIWRDLVQKKQRRAYLLFRRHPWFRFWHKPDSIVWAGLHDGMPRIHREALEAGEEKKAAKLYGLIA